MPFCLSAEKATFPWLNGKHLPWIEKLTVLKEAMESFDETQQDEHVAQDDEAWMVTWRRLWRASFGALIQSEPDALTCSKVGLGAVNEARRADPLSFVFQAFPFADLGAPWVEL